MHRVSHVISPTRLRRAVHQMLSLFIAPSLPHRCLDSSLLVPCVPDARLAEACKGRQGSQSQEVDPHGLPAETSGWVGTGQSKHAA